MSSRRRCPFCSGYVRWPEEPAEKVAHEGDACAGYADGLEAVQRMSGDELRRLLISLESGDSGGGDRRS